MTVLLWSLIILMFVGSLLGVFIPVLPDIVLLWAGVLLYNFLLAVQPLPYSFWMGFGLLTLLIISSDLLANSYFVRRSGGSRLAVLGAIIGLVGGLIVAGPIGIIVGPFLMVLAIALLEKKDLQAGLRVAFATLIGWLGSSLVKIFLQLIIIGWFFIVVI